MAVAASLALASCTIPVDGGGEGEGAPSGAATTATSGTAAPSPTSGPTGEGIAPELAAAVDEVAQRYQGQAGLALADPGDGPDAAPRVAGNLESAVAWSTSKVPVAIAAVRATGAASGEVLSAISASDNAAAEAVWASLGAPDDAARAATEVLRDGGDDATVVNAERLRPEFTAFGQTEWALADQARFGANLGCIAGSGPVLDAMADIAPDQSYGLGSIGGARYKGGWGPDPSGGYLVRQFGVIPTDAGEVGVAIAVRPGDGAYETGQRMLDDIAAVLAANLPPGRTC